MHPKPISLAAQIKKVIGNRILFCSIAFLFIIFYLTVYDLSISVKQLRSRIDQQIKSIEDFAINQAIIDNLDTVELKIDSFNENNSTFHIQWIRQGEPRYAVITWRFPFSWVYDYPINEIAGFKVGYFKITGSFFADKTLIYDLIFRLILLGIFIISVLIVLYPLAKKIPQQLFINPINRFIDLVSNNSAQQAWLDRDNRVPIELQILEEKILELLRTATEHERNKATIELGLLSARLAHDIHSPLAAMEMGLDLLSRKFSKTDLAILTNGIQSVRDIANHVLERYRKQTAEMHESFVKSTDNGNIVRPILLFSLVELIVSQKKHEWYNKPCELTFSIKSGAKLGWVNVAPNEVKRVLSNLLNNAYDALIAKTHGMIHITLSSTDHELHLELQDTGIGIPAEKMTDVLNGESLKHVGKGLGLSGAKKYMEDLSGKLSICSRNGHGTKVKLIFPRVNNLNWFPGSISAIQTSTGIVLDDDFSMLMYWEQRLSEVGLIPKLFSEYDKAMQWIKNNKKQTQSSIFLVDYELAESKTNGLMFLQNMDDRHNRYLITSHAEEVDFQQAAENAHIWLIPKSILSEVTFDI